MALVDRLMAAAGGALHAQFAPGGAYGPPALLGALLCSIAYYGWRRGARGRPTSAKGFVRTIFAKRILLHPSSILDMKLWALNALAFASGYGLLVVSGLVWRGAMMGMLSGAFGAHEPTSWPAWATLGLCTLLLLLAHEFGYWGSHFLFHTTPSLWEFHKVHHSAEVLTTFTEMRTHPVEIIFFMNAIGFCTGMTLGAMTYVFGPGAHPFTLLNGNFALMVFLVTIGHLRHSHMWIPFKGWLGRLLQSPAHHQIHHSDNPKHFNTNLGFSLAVWDWLFGTLYLPQERETIHFGVGARHVDYASVLKLYWLPFKKAAAHLFPAKAHDAPPQGGPRREPQKLAA